MASKEGPGQTVPHRKHKGKHKTRRDLLNDLKSCSTQRDLDWGRGIHAWVVEIGHDSDVHITTALIKMYAKCGSMVEADRAFNAIQNPDVVSWTALILGYAVNGQGHIALELFSEMKTRGCVPDSVTYISALKACTSLVNRNCSTKAQCLEQGKQIHAEIGCHLDLFVQNTLVDMYAKCGSMPDARRVFDRLQKPSLVSWNALLSGYAENGEGGAALDLFSKMKAEQVTVPDSVTYVAVLKACTSVATNGDVTAKARGLQTGRKIHGEIGRQSDHYVQNTLIDMYAKCGSMVEARRVFDGIHKPDVVSWNALLLGYVENGEGQVAIGLFFRMGACVPDSVTYVAALKACSSLTKAHGLEIGRKIHSRIGHQSDARMHNTLIDMYAKCGSMPDARRVFDSIQKPDVVSWNALLLGYVDNGEGHAVLNLFSRMKGSCVPDSVTYIAVLKACTSLVMDEDPRSRAQCLETGKDIHAEVSSCDADARLQSMLTEMYTKCGSMADARRVFDSIQKPDVVACTILLLGYAENGEGHIALELFFSMKTRLCVPDSLTYVAVLKACGSTGALDLGRKFHSEISEFDAHVVTSLVDFYAKCGSMVEARAAFDLHSRARVLSTWNALLAGYSAHGDIVSVSGLFQGMQDEGLRPDAITFLCLLVCCSHAGLVEKAREYMTAMSVHGITPSVMHYNCVLDTLCRGNKLNEAIALLQQMPCNPDTVIWMTILGACRKRKNVEVAVWAFESLMDVDTENAAAYVLLAHVYGSRGMWEEQSKVLEAGLGKCDLVLQ